MTAPERSCFTCRWADRDVCDRPHLSEEMDAAIDAYAVASGCHYNNGGMPTDRSVVCPGHEPKVTFDPEKVANLRERLRGRVRERVRPSPEPRYDDVFHEGLAWLDALASEGCKHIVEPFRVDPDGTVVGKCALCGDSTFVIREGGEDSPKQEGQFAIWTEHTTAPNRMPEPNASLEGMVSSEIGEVKAGTWLLSSGNGATHWRLHSLYSSFEDAYAAHQNLLSEVKS